MKDGGSGNRFDIKSALIGAALMGALCLGFVGGVMYNRPKTKIETQALEAEELPSPSPTPTPKPVRSLTKLEMGTDGNLYAVYSDGTSDRLENPEKSENQGKTDNTGKTGDNGTTVNVTDVFVTAESEDFVFDSKGTTLLCYVGSDRDVVVPDGVKNIGDYAFVPAATFLSSVTLPSTVENIGKYAFAYCQGLGNINFANVRNIGDYAFANTALTSITLPSTVKGIGEKAFSGCILLQYADLSNVGAVLIPDNIFDGCPILSTVYYPGGQPAASAYSQYPDNEDTGFSGMEDFVVLTDEDYEQ